MSGQMTVDVEKFWRDGYQILPVFSPAEVEALRGRAYEQLAEDQARGLVSINSGVALSEGDLLSKPHLRDALLDDRILGLARQILGGQPVYFGDSSFQIAQTRENSAFHGQRHWHRDNRVSDRADPKGLDWQGKYPIIRFGVYLQDHARHSGGLGIRVGSHNNAAVNSGRAIHAGTEPGQVVIWTLRTTHVAHSLRMKYLPQVKLNTGIENRLPTWLSLPQQAERAVMFSTFGLDSDHLTRYMEHFLTRDYAVAYLRASRFGPEAWETARGKDVEIRRLIPEYGTSA